MSQYLLDQFEIEAVTDVDILAKTEGPSKEILEHGI